jgi:cytoskeletal protein RodZ
MATVAEQLRNAREAQHLTLQHVVEITKIRTDHVRAIEEGNYDVFAAPVYIRGFVRTYSTLLKLNVPQVMADLDGELRKTEKFAEPPRLSAEPRGILDFVTLQLSKVNWRIASIILAIAVALGLVSWGYSAWRNQKTEDPLKGQPPALYKPAGKKAGDTLPLTNAPNRTGR